MMKTCDGVEIVVGLKVYWAEFGENDDYNPIEPTIDSGIVKNNGFLYVERKGVPYFYIDDDACRKLCADEKTAIYLAVTRLRKNINAARRRESTLMARMRRLGGHL